MLIRTCSPFWFDLLSTEYPQRLAPHCSIRTLPSFSSVNQTPSGEFAACGAAGGGAGGSGTAGTAPAPTGFGGGEGSCCGRRAAAPPRRRGGVGLAPQ